MTLLLVALGGAAGACLRWAVLEHAGTQRGLLLVNAAGSALLGVLVGAGAGAAVLALLGTGLCGGLTTFSAYAAQVRATGLRTALLHVLVCLPAAAPGLLLPG